MRVALLTDADIFAGTERHILDLAVALKQLPNAPDISIVCPVPAPLAERAQKADIAVIDVPTSATGVLNWQTVRVLRRLLQSGRVQILHAHNGRMALHATLAVALARRGKVVITQHFLAPSQATRTGVKAQVFGAVHKFVNARATHFIAISRAVETQMLARGETEKTRLHTVLNALLQPTADALRPTQAVRDEFGVTESTPLLICAARLEREKSLDVLIEALAMTGENFHCLLAGEGVEKADLQHKIDRAELAKKVVLCGFRDDILSLMNAADIFVLPSEAEPFGLVLLEAMALSKPIIAVNSGGPTEIVHDGLSGILVPPRDATALSAALKKLLNDAPARQKMGAAGRAIFEENFQSERMAREIAAVYDKVMATP